MDNMFDSDDGWFLNCHQPSLEEWPRPFPLSGVVASDKAGPSKLCVGKRKLQYGEEGRPAAAGSGEGRVPRLTSTRPGFGRTKISCKKQSPTDGRKRGREFAVTVGIDEYYDFVREDFLSYFDGIEEYCISVEGFKDYGRCTACSNKVRSRKYHIHAFLKFKEGIFLSDVRYVLSDVMLMSHIDVQPCRSRKSWLKYISKEDEKCLFNVRSDDLHFAYLARRWAQSAESFRFDDPFVLAHYNCYRFLQGLFNTVQEGKVRPFNGFRPIERFRGGWFMDCCRWWNSRIAGFNKKALYLYGSTGVGKSTCVEQLLHGLGERVYLPVAGQFFFGDFNQSYKVVLFEEYDHRLYDRNISHIKRLLEGRTFSVDVKNGARRVIEFKGPVIFVSNDSPPSDDAFLRRLEIVGAWDSFSNYPTEDVDGLDSKEGVLTPEGAVQEIINLLESDSENEEAEEGDSAPAGQQEGLPACCKKT